jgi:hypothetical protein
MTLHWPMIVAFLAILIASTPAIAESTRCDQLVGLFDRHTNYRSTSVGHYLPRRIAEEECRKGNTRVGIRMMEAALDRHRIERDGDRLASVSPGSQ